MEKQVLSISQMEELVSLGIDTSKASMCWDWIQQGDGGYHHLKINRDIYPCAKNVPTFTLQDILEILPKPCYINCIDEDFYQCEITTEYGSLFSSSEKTPLDAVFNMLKSLLIPSKNN